MSGEFSMYISLCECVLQFRRTYWLHSSTWCCCFSWGPVHIYNWVNWLVCNRFRPFILSSVSRVVMTRCPFGNGGSSDSSSTKRYSIYEWMSFHCSHVWLTSQLIRMFRESSTFHLHCGITPPIARCDVMDAICLLGNWAYFHRQLSALDLNGIIKRTSTGSLTRNLFWMFSTL